MSYICAAAPCSIIRAHSKASHLSFKQGTTKDLSKIRQMVIKERMNPLGLPPDRFLVAEDEKGSLLGFGQLQEQPSKQNVEFLELRTLIVAEDARGRGVGSAILAQLISSPAANHKDVYLTTLERTIPFYQKVGFCQVHGKTIPRQLWLEAAAGAVVARIVAQDNLVVLHRPAPSPSEGTIGSEQIGADVVRKDDAAS